jgi:DNA-binding NarL/FixJ family response regulator
MSKQPDKARDIGVVLVEPLGIVRASLGIWLCDLPGIDLVATASSGDDALRKIVAMRRRTSAVVLISLGLDEPNDAYWLIRTLRAQFPTFAILAIGANAEATSISRALFVGADGYMDKSVEPQEFLEGIQKAVRGELVVIGPPIRMLGRLQESIDRYAESVGVLTDREREVLMTAAGGETTKLIAQRLGLRERTVTTHLTRIYSKLGVSGRLAAVRAASERGLISSTTHGPGA